MESVKQEKKDLGKMPGDIKQMSSGSWMSKHISSPLAMGKAHSMAPKMESPMEKELKGGQKNLPEGLKKAIEASPAEMNGSALYHTSTGHGKHVSPERSHPDGKGGTISSHSHDTKSQQKKDRKLSKKQKSEIKS